MQTMQSCVRACLAAIIFAITPAYAKTTVTGDLPRQAALGFSVSAADDGLSVREVEAETPAAEAGLLAGDILTKVNGAAFSKPYEGADLLEKLDGGKRVTLTVRRGGAGQRVAFTPVPRPLEDIPGVDSHYGVVETPDGARLRTIVTRPHRTSGPLPAIFFVQWVSCGSIEYREGSISRQILANLARQSGMALIRVERSTSGDSEGPGCHELDYKTELSHYAHAYRALMKNPHVDAKRVVIYGSSLGSTMAPLLARQVLRDGGTVAGVMVQGGGAVTYLERMLTFDRWYLERRPDKVKPEEIHERFLRLAAFQMAYLIEGRSPDDIAGDSAAMAAARADVRGLGDGVHYGRSYAWHQQAARYDFLAAWAAIDAPVLVVFNEFDQFEGRHGHKLIVDTVNRLRPGTATYVEQPKTGHSNRRFPTILDAYAGENGTPAPEQISGVMLNWLNTKVAGK